MTTECIHEWFRDEVRQGMQCGRCIAFVPGYLLVGNGPPSGRAKRAGGPIADLPAPTHRHPMSGEPIWDQHAVRALCNALRDTLAWMESLRASTDAGFWDWKDDEYTRGVAVLNQHDKES